MKAKLKEEIIVGTCGFTRKRELIYKNLDGVEIQETFYNLINEKRAKALKQDKPEHFVYTMKAWQVITHTASSPTWKKLRKRPTGKISNYGHLKPTEENLTALDKTLAIAHLLGAEVVVLQTPPSMKCSGRETEITIFFDKAVDLVPKGTFLAWEPRGECKNNAVFLDNISDNYNVLIVKDVGIEEPYVNNVNGHKIVYTRLHGIGEKEVNYKYKYKIEDLLIIIDRIQSKEPNRSYIMFNNVYMYDDAVALKKLIAERLQK